MATVRDSAIDEIVADITAGMPGPQDGESVSEYRARTSRCLMEIVEAVAEHKKRVDAFVLAHADAKLDEADQFFNAVRQRFITDEFEG